VVAAAGLGGAFTLAVGFGAAFGAGVGVGFGAAFGAGVGVGFGVAVGAAARFGGV